MTARQIVLVIVLLALLTVSAPVLAWKPVGDGIQYEKFALPDPNNVYVARMLRSRRTATVESSLPQGKLTGAKQTIRAQSALLDDAINWWGRDWGRRNDVVVAINGDWTYLDSGMMYSGQVHSGWYARRIYCEFGGTQFAWTHNRVPFIGGNLGAATQELTVTHKSSGRTQSAQGVNRARGENELIIYTPQYDSTTGTDSGGVEVLVEVSRPTGITPLPEMTVGRVRSILRDRGSTPIPFDHIVLSASGTAAGDLLADVSLGAEIGISQSVDTKETPAFDWSDVYASIGGGRVLVRGGVAVDNSEDKVYASRHPRTAVAYNDRYLFFVVCDGRSAASLGMSSRELSEFLVGTLGSTDALMLDGGGSSTMVVNGVVVNVPSDGRERNVGNGLMMVNLRRKAQSKAFEPGAKVPVAADSDLRLGPGTNYGMLKALPARAAGTIVPHSLNGIYATGCYWWKADFGGTTGWVSQTGLAR